VTGLGPPPAAHPDTVPAPTPAHVVTQVPPPLAAPAAEMPPQITVVRGTQKTTVTVGE
jgi:hypothetical protein